MKQIIAMGGGGFSMEPDNLALDRYVLMQARKTRPTVCFLPTASGDADNYIVKFYEAFGTLECQPSHLSLFRAPTADLQTFLLEKDILYVGGGNTRNMLALWREWGFDDHLRTAWERGVLLAGLSAGAICWFEQGVTDSVPGELRVLNGLGFLEGSCCPHYDGEADRRPAYHRMLLEGEISPGFGVDDGVALHFVDEALQSVVSSRPEARAYKLKVVGNKVQEQVLSGIVLLESRDASSDPNRVGAE
jgi:peptidase E